MPADILLPLTLNDCEVELVPEHAVNEERVLTDVVIVGTIIVISVLGLLLALEQGPLVTTAL